MTNRKLRLALASAAVAALAVPAAVTFAVDTDVSAVLGRSSPPGPGSVIVGGKKSRAGANHTNIRVAAAPIVEGRGWRVGVDPHPLESAAVSKFDVAEVMGRASPPAPVQATPVEHTRVSQQSRHASGG